MSRAWLVAVLAAGVLAVPAHQASAQPTAEDVTTFTPVAPTRVLDTRAGSPVAPGGTITLDLTARVPAGTRSVVLNVTGVAPTAATYVTAYPTGEARPQASNLNLAPGEVRANLVTTRISGTRRVTLYNHAGSTHLVADLAGYYAQGTGGSRFTPTDDNRRTSVTLRARGTASLDLSRYVPESATAVVLNVTGVAPSSDTFLTVWPTGTARPVASNVNLDAGKVTPNLVTVAIGSGRRVEVYNHAGDITVHADLAGFYTPEFGAVFAPRSPARVFDTRTGAGQRDGVPAAIGAGQFAEFHPGQRIPDTAIAAVTNLTGVGATAATYVTATQWNIWYSNLNLVPGQTAANLAVVPLERGEPDPRSYFYNHSGSVDLVADLAGYFWVPPGGCVADCAYSWGFNFGMLGTGTTTAETTTPAQVVGLSGVTDIVDKYALRADGTVWAWGSNRHGELGTGWIGSASTVPVPVRGLTGVVAVAATASTGFALRADGTVWGWGDPEEYHLLGPDVQAGQPVPVQVPGLENVTAIAAGHATAYALRSDGTVLAWGHNGYSEHGNGHLGPSPAPVRVPGLSGVVSISSGPNTAFAVLADGTVRAWGLNGSGQVGNGTWENVVREPVEVPGVTAVRQIAADTNRVYALRADGTVLIWGANATGDGFWTPRPLPLTDVVDVARHALALDGSGRVWTWHADDSGELTPVQVPNLPPVHKLGSALSGGRVLVSTP